MSVTCHWRSWWWWQPWILFVRSWVQIAASRPALILWFSSVISDEHNTRVPVAIRTWTDRRVE